MENLYECKLEELRETPKKWLVTGVAGFIGSNLLETLLLNGQHVVGLDNFATGHKENLNEVKDLVGDNWEKFKFIDGDIRDLAICHNACKEVDYVLHQAALGSVPRSIDDPIATNSTNIDGFLNILIAAKDAKVMSFTYAASSSTYGDHSSLPKREEVIGSPLSPYAVTKLVNELYADVFFKVYGFKSVGLRYFNVFGKRQDPNGSYAAVIPKWTMQMITGAQIKINGDGKTSRDFCYVKNIVSANILAATSKQLDKPNVFNIAVGEKTSLTDLFLMLQETLLSCGITVATSPSYQERRKGDVQHSLADIKRAVDFLGYQPEYTLKKGVVEMIEWYIQKYSKAIG